MRPFPVRFAVLGACLLLLNVGGLVWIRHELIAARDAADGPPQVVETLPAESVDGAERLSVVFDRDVGATTALNAQLDETAPFEISPQLAGHWEWTTPRQLDFVLAEPIPPGRRFAVVPAGGGGPQSSPVVQVDAEIEFRTRPLKLLESRLVSSDRSDVAFELKFNQKVLPDELLSHMRVRDVEPAPQDMVDDETSDEFNQQHLLKVVSLVDKPHESIVLRCSRPATGRLLIEIDADLAGQGGEFGLGEPVQQTLEIAPDFACLRTEVVEVGGEHPWQVDVYFLPGLKPDQDLPRIDVTPAVEQLQTSITTTWRGSGRILRLHGPFESGRQYRATLPRTLLSQDDKPLGEETTIRFEIPEREPSVNFVHSRGILSPDGHQQLDLHTVNVGSLHVHLARVHSNNLVAHLQGTWRQRTSRKLDGKSFRIDYRQNETAQHTINLREVGAVSEGLYTVFARATDRAWKRDRALVTVTDLALTLKQSPREMLVQVMSLRRGESVAGVRVRSVSYNNQTLATGTTDADGLVRIPVEHQHPDGRPWVIIAEQEKQVAWLRTDEDHFVDDHVDQSGRSLADKAFDVLLYTERGTYRPGDTVHLTGIIRDTLGHVPPAFPLSVHVIRPDGREVETEIVTPGVSAETDLPAPGVFHFDFATPVDAWTGPWRFRVTLPGADDELSSTHAYVEEFIPVRMEVKAAAQQALQTTPTPTVDIDARYLFGSPAARLAGEATARYRAVRFQSEAYPDFQFGPQALPQPLDAQPVRFVLDEKGHAASELPAAPESPARWQASIGVTVTEDGGRSVSTQSSSIIDTLNRHIGLRHTGGGVVTVESHQSVEWVVRTAADEPAEFEPLEFQLLRVEVDHVLERVNGRLTWRSIERTQHVLTSKVYKSPAEDSGQLTVQCPQAGLYRLVAVSESGSRTEVEFSVADNDGGTTSASRPEQVDIRLDRSTCRPGETVQAVVTSPFSGRLLLCLEADRILWSRVILIDQTSITVDVTVPPDVRGGAFLSATVIRPVDPAQDDWRPHRASGMARILTDHSAERIPVSITAPASARPGDDVTVKVSAAPHALVHVWAVDEGILATTGYATPSPHKHFYAPRANSVITSDVYADLLPDYDRPANFHRIGGDAGIDSLGRNPVATPRRAAAVVWQGFRSADASGQLSVQAKLPDFTGELRWMVVAVDGQHFGSAEWAMRVTSPLLVESPWPRFAAPGDRFRVPVKMFNTTDDVLTVVTAYIAGNDEADVSQAGDSIPEPGDLTYDGLDSLDFPFELPAGASQTMWLEVMATRLGPVSERVEVIAATHDGTGLDASSAYALSVRPATTLSTAREFLTLKANADVTIEPPPELLPEHSRSTLTVSSQPALELQPAVDRLLRYPYGCVEQTTSRVRAVLAASDWLSAATPVQPESKSLSVFEDRNVTDSHARKGLVGNLVNAGISRLWSMQTRSGGLSYWSGQTEPNLWGSIWAAETLTVARERGFEVDERLVDGLQKYLADSLSRARAGQELDSNLRADVCQILSRIGEPPMGWMSLLSERLDELDMAGRSQLALAWHHAGRRDRALAALPEDTLELGGQVSYSGRFSSPTLQRARLLSALMEIEPEHAWVPQLVVALLDTRQTGVWNSTLENALALDALSAQRKESDDAAPFTGQLIIDGRKIDLTAGQSRRVDMPRLVEPLTLSATGSGQLFVAFETTGLSVDPPAEQDRRLRVRRRWLNRRGDEIDPLAVQVGDLIHVEVTLTSRGRSTIDNVAIVDALPGGLEVENPRLKTSDADIESSPADRVQFLDDRVLIFATATPRTSTFRYALRAVTEGTFVRPAVQASCMYDETLSSIHGAGRIEVGPVMNRRIIDPLAERPEPKTVQ